MPSPAISSENIDLHYTMQPHAIPATMKALVYDSSGRDMMVWSQAMAVPHVGRNEVLVKVATSSLNPFDYRVTESTTMFMGFKGKVVGCDVAGQVMAVGSNITEFVVGDLVFGWGSGLGEYAHCDPHRIAKIPTGHSVGDFGIYPCVGVTAYQLLRKHWLMRGDVQLRNMLVIGAAGGVGSSLIQMARAIGGPEIRIHAVSSGRNEEYLRSIGANEVFNYTVPGFDVGSAMTGNTMDMIVDLVSGTPEGTEYVESAMLLLKPHGKYVTLNTLSKLEYIGTRFSQLTGIEFHKNYDLFIVNRNHSGGDLVEVASLVASGKYSLPILKEIPLDESAIRSAMNMLKQRHMRGKIKVMVDSDLATHKAH